MSEFINGLEMLLIGVAFVSGFVDAIAGGGGLIVVPFLLLTGMNPLEVLGTSKLQALFGSGSATLKYAQQGLVNLNTQWKSALICGLASLLGAMLVSLLPTEILERALPIILIVVAIYFSLSKKLTDEDRNPRIPPWKYALFIAPLIAFYDGIFGPGAGTFYMLGFVLLSGYGLIRATAHTKLLNFASNIGAFVFFAAIGAVSWKIGLFMGGGQFLGARLGAKFAIKGGAKVIKPLIVITTIALALKLLTS